MKLKLFSKRCARLLNLFSSRSKKRGGNGIDLGRYFYFEFDRSEFSVTMTPEALIKAINTKSGIDIPIAYTSTNSLNKLLENQALYKVMAIQPEESVDLISRLKKGENLSLLKIKELNRLLIELNYPRETPKRQRIMALQN